MTATMRRPSNRVLNVLLATGGLSVLLAALAIADHRVRDQFAQILTGQGPSGELAGGVTNVQHVAGTFLQAFHDQAVAYAPLTIFGIAALILVLFMTRT